MILSAVLSAVTAYFSYLLPGANFLWHFADLVVSFAVVTFLFALLFRYVPDERVTWRDVWIGAAATALLFDIGKFLIGFYIGKTSVGSMFGAAGSVVVILAWVYYSSQLVFLGAEFTHVYAQPAPLELARRSQASSGIAKGVVLGSSSCSRARAILMSSEESLSPYGPFR